MPKKSFTINKFDGGLNKKADDRDLLENQLSEAIDIDVSLRGKVKNMGNFQIPHLLAPDTTPVDPGFGLFSFAHDYEMVQLGNTTAEQLINNPRQINTDYLIKVTGRDINIYDFTNKQWLNLINALVANTADGKY